MNDGLAALAFLHAVRDARIEARQIVRDGFRAAGLMPKVLPPRKSEHGHHPGRMTPLGWVPGHYTMLWPGGNGEYRMTPGDLPGENGMILDSDRCS